MKFELAPLPYAYDALEPAIGRKTVQFHYDKHHRGYLRKLKGQIEDGPEVGQPLVEIVRNAKGGVFNNAAQVWNHSFYWRSLKPGGGGKPTGELADLLGDRFGSHDDLRKAFVKEGGSHFGSGWLWIVRDGRGIELTSTHDAGNPLTRNQVPLLAVDLWEHAFYLDYQNRKKAHLEAVFDHLLDWDFASDNWSADPADFRAVAD
jgi:Fe-Mn family superoxide dismutase